MITGLIEYLEGVIETFGAWGVFFAAIVEEVVAPLPSPVVMMGSGFFLLEGPVELPFFFVLILGIAIPYALGATLGSLLVYGLVRYYGEPAIRRWGKWFGISWKHIEYVRSRFKNSWVDEATLFTLRVIPIVPSVALAASCGLVKMRFFMYSMLSVVGIAIRGAVFAFLGWYVGEAYHEYAEHVGRFETAITAVVIFLASVALIGLFIYAQRARRRGVDVI